MDDIFSTRIVPRMKIHMHKAWCINNDSRQDITEHEQPPQLHILQRRRFYVNGCCIIQCSKAFNA
ncbi:unnamed protein product [Linum tenue]|uniref:Uncharacterized protein n=1 Tax=Linum tenue TaxID=586396 RepID=A0AAV0LRH8_9ROSI|nr:unnamed protein product [Linum tenue]